MAKTARPAVGQRDRLVYAKYLLRLAESTVASPAPFSASFAILSLQDAVEMILRAIAQHVNAPIKKNTAFETVIDEIAKTTGKAVPFRLPLLHLNSARVEFKHHGTRPAADEIPNFIADAKAFAQDGVRVFMDLDFDADVSLAAFVQDASAKKALQEAERHLAAGRFPDCVLECKQVYSRIAILFADDRYFRASRKQADDLKRITRVSIDYRLKREHPEVARAFEEIVRTLTDVLHATRETILPAIEQLTQQVADHESLLMLMRRGISLRGLDKVVQLLRHPQYVDSADAAQLCLSYVLEMMLAHEQARFPTSAPPGLSRS